MDVYAKRIMNFLSRNSNLDLEAPDIAFHLKLDENFTLNCLNSLYRQQLVTVRRNEYGRVYWYILTTEPEAAMFLQETSKEALPGDLERKGSEMNKDMECDSYADEKFDSLAEKSGFPMTKLVIAILMAALIAGGGILMRKYLEKRIDAVVGSVKKEVVPSNEFKPFKDDALGRIEKMEAEIKGLVSNIDSLKSALIVLETANKEASKRVTVKATAKRKK